jgi:hypothetical protein
MSSKLSGIASRGSKLAGKIVTLVGYEWVVSGPFEIKKGKNAGTSWSPLELVWQFQVDDTDSPTPKRFRAGDSAMYGEVSEDLLTLDTPGDIKNLSAISEAGIFMQSLGHPEEGDGFPEDRLSDEDNINYEPIIGTRLELTEVANQWALDNDKRQVNQKTGKDYEIRDLKVLRIIELPKLAKATVASKTAAKPTLVKGKPAPAPVEEETVDASDAAAEAFCRYIAKEPVDAKLKVKAIKSDKLRMKVVTDPAFKKDADLKAAVLEIADSAEALAELAGLDYNAKTKVLTIAA